MLANHNAQALQRDSQKEGKYNLKIIPLPWLKSSKAIILVSNDYFISQHAFCPNGDSTGINCDDASWLHQLPQKEEATGKALVLIPALLARGSDSIYLESGDIYALPFYNLIARSLVNLNENMC